MLRDRGLDTHFPRIPVIEDRMTISQYTPQTSSHLYLRRFKVLGWYVTTWGPVIPVASSFGLYGLTGYQRDVWTSQRPAPTWINNHGRNLKKNGEWGDLKPPYENPRPKSAYASSDLLKVEISSPKWWVLYVFIVLFTTVFNRKKNPQLRVSSGYHLKIYPQKWK